MESMEVDNNLEASISASTFVIEPIEGSSINTNTTLTSTTTHITTVKSNLNTPWFVYLQVAIKCILFLNYV